MKIDLSQFRETFLQESAEHVAAMEDGLLALRSAPDDVELMHAIFRSAHSIKGGAGTFALTGLVRFTHVLENLLDRLRAMEMPVTDAVIALLLQSVDGLRGLLASGAEGEPPAMIAELHAQLEALLASAAHDSQGAPNSRSEPNPQAEPNAALEPSDPSALHPTHPSPVEGRYRVCFHPSPEIFMSGSNPLLLVRNLAMLGTVESCLLDSSALPPLEELDPARSYLRWEIELSTVCEEAEIREVFEFVEHLASVQIERLPEPGTADAAPPATASSSARAAAPPKPAESAAPARPAPRRAARPDTESATIRVATDKVDRLIDLMGELVIAHGMAEQMVEHFTPACLPQLREAVAAMERSTRELHERVMSIRMLPVGSLFQRYTRTVYDIAQTTGKQIDLELSGEDTELDKSMLDLLADPLTHLIRNAADHGIEAPADRAAAGKPEQGTIRLRAQHRSGRIVIEITDDGAGINLARVRAKAVERGMIAPDAQLSDDQIRMLIFEAGFSTRDQVSDLSGRGVGMDVVKRNIERLNGSISLHSEPGLGSRVALELPLTLAIVEGLLVRVGDRTLVLPLLEVVETVSPVPGQIVSLAGRGEAIMIHGESVAVLRLHRFLGIATGCDAGLAEARCLVVVVEAGHRKIGLVIDEILGQQQVVLKSLERHLHKVDGLMGATILGDGCVAPILDVAALARLPLYAPEMQRPPIPSGPVIAAMDAAAQPQPAVLSG